MTLRLVFGWEDLQRVRLAAKPDPMWELVLGLNRVRNPGRELWFSRWQRQVHDQAERDKDMWWQVLFSLVPYPGAFPDFLTPAPSVAEIGAGCEAILCTSRHRLRRDLAATFTDTTTPGWIRELATGDRGQRESVVDSAHAAYDRLIAPFWDVVQMAVAADRAERIRILGRVGVGALLAGIPGVEGWDGQVLRVKYPRSRTAHLAGRGMTLIPSYFCSAPVSFVDDELPPILVYPVTGPSGAGAGDAGVPRQLVALLGRTRAECLAALAAPCSTSALADHLGMSIGTASKQAAVLRDAGLAASQRRGGAVLHQLTQLGEHLLTGEDFAG